MSDEGGEKKTIDHVVESFVGRLRAGEKPSIAEYQQLYPASRGRNRAALPVAGDARALSPRGGESAVKAIRCR